MSGMYISGLASGIDTDALITELMQLEGKSITRLESQKQQLLVKANAWKDVRMRLVNLQHSAGDLNRSLLDKQRAAISSDSKTVGVIAAPSAETGNYRIEVATLARAHSVTGFRADEIAEGTGAKGPLGLSGSLVINGVTVELVEADSLQDISKKIDAAGAGVEAEVIDTRLVLTRTRTGGTEIKIKNSVLNRALEL